MVNYQEAIVKPFTDMKKLIIGVVVSIIPIVNFAATGFAIESSGVGRARPSKNMPEWKDWMHLFVQGLTAAVIQFVYLIPALVIFAITFGMVIMDVANVLVGSNISPEMRSQIGWEGSDISDMLMANWIQLVPGLLAAAPVFMLGILLAIVASFLSPMAILNSVRKKSFKAAFEFGAVAKKALNMDYLIAWIAVLVVSFVLGAILSIIPFIGGAIAFFVVGVISYSLFGQVYTKK